MKWNPEHRIRLNLDMIKQIWRHKSLVDALVDLGKLGYQVPAEFDLLNLKTWTEDVAVLLESFTIKYTRVRRNSSTLVTKYSGKSTIGCRVSC